MFGKVPSSNTASPSSHGGLSLSKSCTRPTGTACLPCFSVDENCASSNEDKPKPWRPKDVGLASVVSEAPCNTLQICPTPCPNGLTSPVCSTRVVPLVPKHSSKESSTTVHVARNHLGTKNGSPNITVNSVHKCSSNPNCPSFAKSTCCSGASANRGPQRGLTSSSLSNLSVDNHQSKDVLVAGTSSTRKKHRDAVLIISKDQANGKMFAREQQVTRNPLTQAASPLANNPKSTRLSSEAVHSVATSGKSGRSSSCTETTIARDDLIVTDSSSNFANDAIVPANGYQTESSSYVGQKSRTCGGKDNSGDCVASSSPVPPTASISSAASSSSSNITTTSSSCSSSSSSGTCNDRGSSHRSDFTSSTPAKDWQRNGVLESTQPSCMSCLPQELPTELQSSPRSYKDREKCRDPWRPTEMDSGIYGLNPVCPGDSGHQDVALKRRTGASCQALRHAVASLNRLDDFYMEKIGAGFFSEVFKVTHKVTSQVMVLKMNQLPANRPNMLKEVQLMNKLSHPNILRFMGVCVHEGQLHALTEYINGGSLEQLIMSRHTALPHAIRMNLARDVARGMAYLHSRGLFHRDLTSKNVLIKRDEISEEEHLTAVVGDFGLAAKIPDPSSGYRLSTVGSPYWMSPECLKGQWYDHRSDVFSFGIVVCELIGRVPADPDVLPRSDNFGLDYLAVAEICAAADPPPAFLQLAFNCCTYEPKSRPTFPEIVTCLDGIIANYDDESKGTIGKRQSADPTLMSSMDEIVREGRTTKRRTSRLRSQSADARGCDNATPSDKARCHSARRVAELASRRDPHYRPMTANPFHALGGVKKILGDLFSSCLELPSLEDVRPSVTDTATKFKPAQNDSIAKILDRKKPNSEPSSPTARKKWERKVATKVGAASLFAHPLFRDGWEPRRRGSCESGFWSCVGEDLSPEPPNRRHTSTLSSSAASSLFLLDDHRTSSIYTDSSEDIASLGGGDSSCWEDRLSGIGSSSKTISKIVEYFERKQATASSLRLGDHDAGPSRIALLRASLDGPVPLCSISAAQRLVVCEGAVRSKLPLFDKK